MNRKTIFCMIILTTLLLSGCTRNNSQGSENSSGTGSSSQTGSSTETQTGMQEQSGTQEQSTSQTDSHATNTQNTSEEQNMITEEEARQIALTHANLSADQVSFTKSEIDREDGRIVYDIEFHTKDNKEFDYEIDPYTGEVLDYDHDIENTNNR